MDYWFGFSTLWSNDYWGTRQIGLCPWESMSSQDWQRIGKNRVLGFMFLFIPLLLGGMDYKKSLNERIWEVTEMEEESFLGTRSCPMEENSYLALYLSPTRIHCFAKRTEPDSQTKLLQSFRSENAFELKQSRKGQAGFWQPKIWNLKCWSSSFFQEKVRQNNKVRGLFSAPMFRNSGV